MNIRHTYDGKTLIIYLAGDMDHYRISKLRTCVDEMIEWYRPKTLTLDYMDVIFMDSAGIGFILGRIKKVRSAGGIVNLRNTTSTVERILQMSRVDKFAKII